MLSISPGTNAYGDQWWDLIEDRGLVVTGNTVTTPSRYGPLRGDKRVVSRIIAETSNRVLAADGSYGPWTCGPGLSW